MAFCTNCGSQTDARFCAKCGQPVGVDAPGPTAPPLTPQPGPQTTVLPPGKPKTNPMVWIIAAIVGVFVLVGILFLGTGLFVAYKVKNAGFDSRLAEKNPALAAAKVMAALNPNVEVVKVDEDRGLLTVRDKKTGKTITMDAEGVKNGKLTFSDDSTNEKFSFGADSAAKLPAWLPSYPGSKPEGTFSMSGSDAADRSEGGAAHFKTSDAGAKVLTFYQQNLKNAGFKITSTFSGDSGESRGGILTAEDTAKRRTVMVTVSSTSEGTDVALTYGSTQ